MARTPTATSLTSGPSPPEETQWKPLTPAPMHVLRNNGTAPKGLSHYQDEERPDLD